ncbi:MAG: hypothetical protein WAO69_16545 [Aestuariivita sp.]|uniref:hypothetical protein n=1 Tax=Aestuariivita sp. TaxID=1872407 RepID=UPI003BAE898E
MTFAWILTYAVVFVGGPCIVLWLMRPQASVAAVRRLGILTMAMVVLSIGATMLGAPGSLAAAMLWGAWVSSMALMGHVLRLMIGSPGARRWTAAMAAVGATIPWFGLLIARAVAG